MVTRSATLQSWMGDKSESHMDEPDSDESLRQALKWADLIDLTHPDGTHHHFDEDFTDIFKTSVDGDFDSAMRGVYRRGYTRRQCRKRSTSSGGVQTDAQSRDNKRKKGDSSNDLTAAVSEKVWVIVDLEMEMMIQKNIDESPPSGR